MKIGPFPNSYNFSKIKPHSKRVNSLSKRIKNLDNKKIPDSYVEKESFENDQSVKINKNKTMIINDSESNLQSGLKYIKNNLFNSENHGRNIIYHTNNNSFSKKGNKKNNSYNKSIREKKYILQKMNSYFYQNDKLNNEIKNISIIKKENYKNN